MANAQCKFQLLAVMVNPFDAFVNSVE